MTERDAPTFLITIEVPGGGAASVRSGQQFVACMDAATGVVRLVLPAPSQDAPGDSENCGRRTFREGIPMRPEDAARYDAVTAVTPSGESPPGCGGPSPPGTYTRAADKTGGLP